MTAYEATVDGTRLVALQGDLTAQDVGAVVNAANRELQHGGGVAAAIARAGGPVIQEESDLWIRQHGPLGDGVAAITSGGDLPASHVIHTAGPVYDAGSQRNEPRLRAAVRGALELALENDVRSLAFPAISAGIYGYPPDEATAVLADEVVAYVREHPSELDEVRLVGLDEAMTERFVRALRDATVTP